MFSAEHLFELLAIGWMTTIPLGVGSILTLGIFFERLFAFRGVEADTRTVASEVIDALAQRDLDRARTVCAESDVAASDLLGEGLRWRGVDVEDLDRVFATVRAEMSTQLRRGIWVIGTVGSLAPFVGLFGTVIGIIRAFSDMAEHGSGGFAVVANGIAEALVATAAGLGVAIVALVMFNYLQVRVQALNATYARACERFVQALIYVDSSSAVSDAAPGGDERAAS